MTVHLFEFFRDRVGRGEPLVLATVFETAGSTYSKAGGQMVIDGDGQFCGMLSGGCLEGDLAERAREVISSRTARTVSYDLGADDELWGLGVGCDGTMRVLLQPLYPEQDFQPFAAIVDIGHGHEAADLALVIDGLSSDVDAGASLLLHKGECRSFGMDDDVAGSILRASKASADCGMRQVATSAGSCRVLFMRVAPPPALLVLGAGPDAEPVVTIASELGWRCTVADHRPAYLESRLFSTETNRLCCPADQLAGQLELDNFDLALVMSHHLATDRAYLRQLAKTEIGYLGLLGPVGRRDRLLHDLRDVAPALLDRLHGPAGIPIGGRGPGPIALAIVAEMQQYLNERG